MEADDLLCSRNARPPKALVGRAQWKIKQPPSLEEISSEFGGNMYIVRRAQLSAPQSRLSMAHQLNPTIHTAAHLRRGGKAAPFAALLDALFAQPENSPKQFRKSPEP
jgi:hypothetical protein